MKKLSAVLIMLVFCAGCAFAEGEASRKVREGTLAYSNMTIEQYKDFIDEAQSQNVWNYYLLHDPKYSEYVAAMVTQYIDVYTFDSMSEMIMALNAGKIDTMELSSPVGEYFMKQNNNADKYITFIYTQGVNYYLSMGFRDGNKWFEPFNAAIKAMNEDDTLLLLKAKYVTDSANKNLKPVKFEKFPNAETVKIAITGDMPPIDYIAADGTPAGFNTAMLAEIGRRLKVNIELVSITAGARAAALASGRADGVFWFWFDKTTKTPRDVPAEVVLTEPYYSYDTFMYIGKKISK